MEIYDFGITDLAGVVENINNSAVFGFENLTSEYKAASHAASAALESDDSIIIDGDNIGAHLEFLISAGAVFDNAAAVNIGVELAAGENSIFGKLDASPATAAAGAELFDLWIENGAPEPAPGPSTSYVPAPFQPAKADEMGDWGGKEDVAAAAYEEILNNLYEAAGVSHTGSGIFHTQYNNSEQYNAYQEAAVELINDFVSADLFARFCDEELSDE